MLPDTLDYSRIDYSNFMCDCDYHYGCTFVQVPAKRYALFHVNIPILSFNTVFNISETIICANSYCFFQDEMHNTQHGQLMVS